MKLDTEQIVHLFHVLIVGTLFLYVGLRRDKIPSFLFPVLLALGAVIIVYHLFKIYLKARKGEGYWVNLIHVLLVGPLLVYIGMQNKKTGRKYYELLLMLGFASIGYHGLYMIRS
jgi:hypothetical protein